MKKTVVSFLLLLCMMLTLLPFASFASVAGEPERAPAGEVLTGEDLYYTEGLQAFLIADEEWVTINDDGTALWRDSLTGVEYTLSGGKLSIASTVTVQQPAVKDIPADATKEYVKVTYAEDGTTPLYRVTTTLYYSTTASTGDANQYYLHSIDGVPYVVVKQEMKGEVYDPASGTYTQDTSVADYKVLGWELTEQGLGYSLPDIFSPNAYRQSSAERPVHSINLGAILPDGEYTLEWVSQYTGYTDTDGYGHSLAQASMYEGDGDWSHGFYFGPLKMFTRMNATPGVYAAWIAYTHDTNINAQANRIKQATSLRGVAGMTSLTLDKIAEDGGNYTYDWKSNGDELFSMTTGETVYIREAGGGIVEYIPNSALSEGASRDLVLNSDLPGYTYAIRIYNRVLTEEQKIQNHFADLACFYDFDLTEFSAMSKEHQTLLMSQMYSFGFSSDAASAQADLDATIKGLTFVPTMNDYDKLYVQKGLSVLLTAYNPENEETLTVDSSGGGKWANKVLNEDGSFDSFILTGRRETREYFDENGGLCTTVTGWQKYENGVGYEMTQAAARGSMKGSHYLNLGLEHLPDGNFTVEIVTENLGMPMEGTETVNWANGDQGKNWYEVWDYIFKVGNFSVYSKHTTHTTATGIANLHAIAPSFTSNGDWNNCGPVKLMNQQLTSYDYNTLGIYNATFKLQTLEDDSIKASYAFGLRGEALYDGSSVTYGEKLAEAGFFRLFADTPSIVYAVRVYDHALTPEEHLQNHFADLCAYHQLNLDRFSAIAAEDRIAVYKVFENYDFTTDKALLQDALDNAMSAILLTFEGFTAKIDGVGNELSAIFSANTAKIGVLENQGYKITTGILMAPLSDTVNAFSALTTETAMKSELVYTTDDGALALIGETQKFGYSVFFDRYTRPNELCKKYVFRAYVTLEKDGESVTYYNNAYSGNFGDGVSMLDVCNYLTAGFEKYKENATLLSTANSAYTDYPIYLDAKNGSDNGDGSEDAPFKTISAAINKINSLLAEEGDPLNIILNILTGDYYTSEALTLDGSLFSRDYRLNIKGTNATVSGNYEVPLSSFSPVVGTDYLSYPIPSQINNRLFRSFYVDGKLATLASTEEALMTRSFTYFTETGTRKFADEAYKDENDKTYFVAYVDRSLIDQYFPADQIANRDVDIAGTELWIKIEWYYMGFRIVDIDFDHSLGVYATVDNESTAITNKNYEDMYALVLNYDDASVYTSFKNGVMSPQHDVARGKDLATLKNSIYLLDEPGEYYYDLEGGVINYIPQDGDTTAGIATVENLFILKDVANVSFSGVTFTGTNNNSPTEEGYIHNQAGYSRKTVRFGTEAALYGFNVSNLTVDNCSFLNLYASGIVLRGANRNIDITGNSFDYIGSSAIIMGDPTNWGAETNAHTNIKIENNYLHDIAFVLYSHCAMTITKVQNLSICHNTIINCSYTGISVGWSWGKTTADYGTYVNILGAEIAYNYIENYMCLLYDGGAIYTLGGNADESYTSYFNFLHDNYAYCGSYEGRRVCDNTSTCWYHDGASSHWYTYNNVVWVDVESMSMWSYISLQGTNGWGEDIAQQVYNIETYNNFFINLYQDYLTTGYGRVKYSKNLIEMNSHIMTKEDVYELADTLVQMQMNGEKDRHGQKIADYMLIDPDSFEFIESALVDEMNSIITSAGCDRQKGRALEDLYLYMHKSVENPGEPPLE